MALLDEVGLMALWEKIKAYVKENAAAASKLTTARAIDGVNFDGTVAINHYGTCSTSGSTVAKTVSLTNFKLVTGAKVAVRFSYANTATNPTLNVNSTGAKPIYYRGSAIPASLIREYMVLELVYSGSYWYVIGDIDTPVLLSSTQVAASSVGTWIYSSAISALSKYDEIRVFVNIGDGIQEWVTLTRNTTTVRKAAYLSASYYGRMAVTWDTTNSKVGLYVYSYTGWTLAQFSISRIEGVVRKY